MSWSDFADAARTTWVFKNTLKASLSKLMWDTRATAGAYHERDRGQQFFLWTCWWLDTTRSMDVRMTHCTDLIYASGLSLFIWPMGRRGVFDVCETWCRDGEADVPLLADVHGRIPERMTWWGERWHRDSTPTNVKKERAWEYSTWSDTPVVATHFLHVQLRTDLSWQWSFGRRRFQFLFWRRDCYEVRQQTLRTQN